MPARSVNDKEISLIKAMLRFGMKNKDIQFFFNRPDRSVNSGRITGIRKGTYGNSSSIVEASEAEVKSFMDDFEDNKAGASPEVLVVVESVEKQILTLFAEDAMGVCRLSNGETDEHECKLGFGFKHPDKWLRAIAALANNRGGFVFFGVHDKDAKGPSGEDLSHVAAGLQNEEFLKADPVAFTKVLKSYFDPTPRFQLFSAEIGGKRIGAIKVEQHPSRPIIATKSDGEIREGDIFYRYPGQSSRIKYSDLRSILDERDTRSREQILPMVEQILRLGPSRAMVADLEAGALTDGKGLIQIDERLLETINFIKEGEFDEVKGAPTLRLVGEVQRTSGAAPRSIKGVITRSDLITDFLSLNKVHNPEDYIRFAVESGNGEWMPLRYYAHFAGLDRQGLFALIESTKAAEGRKKLYLDRLAKNDSAYVNHGGTPADILDRLEGGDRIAIQNARDASYVAKAIQGIHQGTDLTVEYLASILLECHNFATGPGISVVRRAACRVDEVFFALKQRDPRAA